MQNSRTKNAKLNIIYGYIAQMGILLLSFVGRRVFLHFLSADYLGINGLYTNILTILSLPELGMDTAIIYSLFKPIADDDKALLSCMLRFFKKIYFVIAICIVAVGICLVPFLGYLINSDLPSYDLICYYLLFLLNTTASYFVAYKVALLSAYQEQRIHKLVTLSANFILQILHIIALLIWKNYYVYLVTTVCTTLISNLILNHICNKRHKDIFQTKQEVEFDTKPIKKHIISVFFYKIGAVLINSTDNILISVLVSTLAVGYYSNYHTVITAVSGFISIISSSLIAGIGNLSAQEKKADQGALFDMMVFVFHTIAAIGLVGFSLLLNNFIILWLGEEYIFDKWTVFIIAFNFYVSNAIAPIWMFREANGLFDRVKFLILIRAAFNIVLSVAFGILWGVFGIILATIVSLVITSFWYEPRIISREVFGRSSFVYWRKQVAYFSETCVSFGLGYLTTMHLGDSFMMLCVKAIILIAMTGGVFLVCNMRTKEYKKIKRYVFSKW